MVLALNQAARIVPGRYVPEPNIARQAAEERNTVSNEHGHARDDETLNEPCAKEPLNRDPTVDVNVAGATSSELRNDLSGSPGHEFNNASGGRHINGAATQHHHALVHVGPGRKRQNFLEGHTAYHDGVDACQELVVAVRFAAALQQKVEIAVPPRDEAVDAGADKDRYGHQRG